MSWRHAPSVTLMASTAIVRNRSELSAESLRRNFGDSYGMQPFEKLPRRMTLESRIRRLDDEEEAIGRCAPEGVDVEDRVIRLRQLVQRPHADKRRERRSENRSLKRHRDELRPAVERAIADVHRVGHHRVP